MKEKIIEFIDFSFKYKAQQESTLKHINLTIYKGEKVLIIGPSGSGKTTLGYAINGIIPSIYQGDSQGQLLIHGKPAFDLSIYETSLLVSTVLQDTDGQFIGLSVAEDLAFALENDVVAIPEMKERVHEWANRLELEDLLSHRPQDLSGGQKQRVSLAGVLIDESPLLLFDEPLANLDPKSGQDTIDLIDRLHAEEGVTTIIIEHRLEDVLYRTIDRLVLINDGQILYNGAPDGLLRSTLLRENGIREPLYLTSLRQLGVDFDSLSDLANLDNLVLPAINIEKQEVGQKVVKTDCPLLEMKNVFFSYPNKKVLKDINLTIHQGEKLAIIGKNGAGKSTLAKALCGFVGIEGDILWKGRSILSDSVKERSERIGYVLQNPNQMISQTMIFDEIALGLKLRGFSEEVIQERVDQVLQVCGLAAFRNWPISALSYGQKKRVTIASILVLNPDIILLDEPTAGQDYKHYTEMMEFLDELNQQGHTIVMITHDMQLMLDYSDRAVVLVDGQIIYDTSPAQVLTNPDILKKANLKETSIFKLAQKLDLDPLVLTQFYMKGEKSHE